MKPILILSLLFCSVSLYAKLPENISMDAADPIIWGGNYIIYKGEKIALNEHAFLIDGNMTQEEAEKYPYIYNSINDAVVNLTDGTEQNPMILYIAPNVYWIDDPDDPEVRVSKEGREPFGMKIKCNWLTFKGLTRNPENVVLACNRGQMEGAVGNFTMFYLDGDGIRADNLTMGNYCNVDLAYPLKTSLNRAKRMDAITQAQLAYCTGDKIRAHNCRFISRLNLCPMVGGKRTLFDNCHFESTDDALCATGVYLHCDFDFYGSKPLYASARTGAVFMDCDFRVKGGKRQYITKAESPVMLIDCRYHAGSDVYLGWTQDPTDNLTCYQSNVTLNGKQVILGKGKKGHTVDMTNLPLLDAYKVEGVYNTYNLLRGGDDWDPMGVKSKIQNLEKTLHRNLSDIPVFMEMQASVKDVEEGRNKADLTLVPMRMGGEVLSVKDVLWDVNNSNAITISSKIGLNNVIESIVRTDSVKEVTVTARAASGLEASVVMEARPARLLSPKFTQTPVLKIENKEAVVSYQLDLGGRADESLVTWYRCKDKSGSDAIPVAVSRLNKPLKCYTLHKEDIGYYLKVSVAPKHVRSDAGESVEYVYSEPIRDKNVKYENVFYTDFVNFPTDYQPLRIPGFWTVDAYKPEDTKSADWQTKPEHSWYYGKGFDGAVGEGLMQENKGARLLYTPLEAKYGDMEVTLEVDPCKPIGQGFGSATSQYMDVYIKMNTKKLTGYALRIIRTTKYHNAVDFVLVRYTNGHVEEISQPVSSTCYRTRCTLSIKAVGNELTAHAETTAEPSRADLPNKVNLKAVIEPNDFGGTGVQHTGSTGPSATMLHEMKISYITLPRYE